MVSANATSLAAMWARVCTLTPTSSPSSVEEIATFFSPTATVYLSGMGQPPCTDRASLIAGYQTLLTFWKIEEHQNVTHIEQRDGKVIVNTMDNKLRIMGELVEGFKECEVVTFDDEGKIERYELYVDPSPIMAIFAKQPTAES